MATLDEILALFPDNATGDIGANDIRAAITALWDNDSHLDARVAALEAANSSGDSFSVTGVWQVNPVAGATPQGGQVAGDTSTFSTATVLKFNKFDRSNQEATAALMNCTAIFTQMRTNSSNWVTFTRRAAATTDGTTITVPVTVTEASGTIGSVAWQEAAIVLNVSTSAVIGEGEGS